MSNSEDPKTMQAFEALNETALAHLQGKYGQEIRLTTTRAALNEILRGIDRRLAGAGGLAAYDRGFDRTSPGYDKFYDRDRASINPADAIINPGVDLPGARE